MIKTQDNNFAGDFTPTYTPPPHTLCVKLLVAGNVWGINHYEAMS